MIVAKYQMGTLRLITLCVLVFVQSFKPYKQVFLILEALAITQPFGRRLPSGDDPCVARHVRKWLSGLR